MTTFVVAVIATYGRPRELARLLHSLEKVRGLGGVVVTDNGNDSAVREIVKDAQLNTCYLAPSENLGCGGGLALAEKTALEKFGEQLTHVWTLDDDAIVPPDVLEVLTREMQCESADAACPNIMAPDGKLGWFPGLLDKNKFDIIRQPQTPAEFVAKCGSQSVAFSWSTGVSLLVTRRVITELGFHRDDFWVHGEDLEFSLRITYRHKGIFVPTTVVQHLPPTGAAENRHAEMLRSVVMLQNVVYMSLYLPHARRILRTIPGNFFRFLCAWPARNAIEVARAFWRGAILAQPGGHGGQHSFRARFYRSAQGK